MEKFVTKVEVSGYLQNLSYILEITWNIFLDKDIKILNHGGKTFLSSDREQNFFSNLFTIYDVKIWAA